MAELPSKIALFGSTGSIGASAIAVIRAHPEHFKVSLLSAGSRLGTLMAQIGEFRPALAVIANPLSEAAVTSARNALRSKGIKTELLVGSDALISAARDGEYDTLLGAITGAAGLASTLEAAKRGKRIALANKESLVMAGPLLMGLVASNGAELLPVDSEHSAVWQCLRGEQSNEVERIILTASGGPFRTRPAETFKDITLEEALKHPTWEMGEKITIDSATLMNKALEIIEARWLFDTPAEKLGALIHPQSIVHSMVEFIDGSMMAQLGVTTMELPIQLALGAPQRLPTAKNRLSLKDLATLTFEEVDGERFPLFPLGLEVAKAGGTAGAIFNAANEIAVAAFLAEQIAFMDIHRIVARTLEVVPSFGASELAGILDADRQAREFATSQLTKS